MAIVTKAMLIRVGSWEEETEEAENAEG